MGLLQNLNDYLPSFLIMAGGVALVLTGFVLTAKLYMKEKREQSLAAAADLNRQINETTRSARNTPSHLVRPSYQPNLLSTVDMNATVAHPINPEETVLMEKELDETSILPGSSSSSRPKATHDQAGTAYLFDVNKR